MGISDPKNLKIPNFANLFASSNPLIDIHEIISYMCLWGLRKCVKFGVIRCLTEGVIGRNRNRAIFTQFLGAPGAKTMGQIRKKVEVQKWDGHAKFGEDRLDARRQEMKQCCFLFVEGRSKSFATGHITFYVPKQILCHCNVRLLRCVLT